MSGKVEGHMKERGIALPKAAAPGANYISFVRTGNLVFISGQIAKWNGEHARSEVGVATLPYGVAVEIEGTFEVEGA